MAASTSYKSQYGRITPYVLPVLAIKGKDAMTVVVDVIVRCYADSLCTYTNCLFRILWSISSVSSQNLQTSRVVRAEGHQGILPSGGVELIAQQMYSPMIYYKLAHGLDSSYSFQKNCHSNFVLAAIHPPK